MKLRIVEIKNAGGDITYNIDKHIGEDHNNEPLWVNVTSRSNLEDAHRTVNILLKSVVVSKTVIGEYENA